MPASCRRAEPDALDEAAAEALTEAAQLIATRGLAKGWFTDREAQWEGTDGVWGLPVDTAPLCSMGALNLAVGGVAVSHVPDERRDVLHRAVLLLANAARKTLVAEEVVVTSVVLWNDQPDTTQADVVLAMRRAALYARRGRP